MYSFIVQAAFLDYYIFQLVNSTIFAVFLAIDVVVLIFGFAYIGVRRSCLWLVTCGYAKPSGLKEVLNAHFDSTSHLSFESEGGKDGAFVTGSPNGRVNEDIYRDSSSSYTPFHGNSTHPYFLS